MATIALPAITPMPNTFQVVDSPWKGQGLNPWSALVWNLTPFAIAIAVSTSTYWIPPFTLDYYEFPDGVYSFGMVPTNVGNGAVGTNVGYILVTAFDQSSSYDGAFPVALTQPALQQTFTVISSGQLTLPADRYTSGQLSQSFDALFLVMSFEAGTDPVRPEDELYFVTLTAFDATGNSVNDSKGRFTSGYLNLSCIGAGDQWSIAFDQFPFDANTVGYTLYGVTIADTTSLLYPPAGVSQQSGIGSGSTPPFSIIEPYVRSGKGSKLAITGWYEGPAQILYYGCDATGQVDANLERVLISDPTNSAFNVVQFSLVVPSQDAWIIFVEALGVDVVVQYDINVSVG